MDYEYKTGEVGLKIKSASSMAKCIAILRKYNPVSMAEIKNAIETGEYVLTCSYISHPGIRKIRKCYDELVKSGQEVEIYEHDRLTTRELISNLIASHRKTEREVREQMEEEALADENNEE